MCVLLIGMHNACTNPIPFTIIQSHFQLHRSIPNLWHLHAEYFSGNFSLETLHPQRPLSKCTGNWA